jgi:catechol 2,3-dioxygenase-like lactoylglutathione lyase family enzyme
MLINVLHFSFTVSSIDAAIDWYTKVLGLEFVERQRQENEYTAKLVAMPGAILEVARFRIPQVHYGASNHFLELVEYVHPKGEKVSLEINKPGMAHLAFIVDDIDDRYQRMVSLGMKFRNKPEYITAGANQGGYVCYFSGPDGETLEFLQPSAERLALIKSNKEERTDNA